MLEDQGFTIGAVTGVQGILKIEVTVTGQSAHAGTTPMRLRHDPGFVAAITTGVRHRHRDGAGTQVATVGRCEFHPNLVNVVPATVTLTVDLRNTDEGLLQQAEEVFAAPCEQLAGEEGVTIERRTLARFQPVEFDESMIGLVESTARALGHTTMRMPSGAGHDAQMLARVCPTGMIFVPSVDGLSHNIAEYTTPADVVAGADVQQVVLAAAGAHWLPCTDAHAFDPSPSTRHSPTRWQRSGARRCSCTKPSVRMSIGGWCSAMPTRFAASASNAVHIGREAPPRPRLLRRSSSPAKWPACSHWVRR